MLRAGILIAGIAVILLATIWGIAELSGNAPERIWESQSFMRRKTVICHKMSEDVQFDGKVCIYMCEDGEKTRVDKLKMCLPKIEI